MSKDNVFEFCFAIPNGIISTDCYAARRPSIFAARFQNRSILVKQLFKDFFPFEILSAFIGAARQTQTQCRVIEENSHLFAPSDLHFPGSAKSPDLPSSIMPTAPPAFAATGTAPDDIALNRDEPESLRWSRETRKYQKMQTLPAMGGPFEIRGILRRASWPPIRFAHGRRQRQRTRNSSRFRERV